jgi:GNAT superfamily N-acetyltransferase
MARDPAMRYTVRPLDASTWDAFAELVERNRREYGKDAPPRPDWRITCFYVDKKHRGQGIARAALEGALDQIARAGGGLIEAISEVTAGREAPGRFLFSATVELFEQYGFSKGRRVGKHAWIVSKQVAPA